MYIWSMRPKLHMLDKSPSLKTSACQYSGVVIAPPRGDRRWPVFCFDDLLVGWPHLPQTWSEKTPKTLMTLYCESREFQRSSARSTFQLDAQRSVGTWNTPRPKPNGFCRLQALYLNEILRENWSDRHQMWSVSHRRTHTHIYCIYICVCLRVLIRLQRSIFIIATWYKHVMVPENNCFC